MTSFRFPQIEVLDCIRQLIYIKDQAQWDKLGIDNPAWQLNKREVYSLNGPKRNDQGSRIMDSDGNFIPQPYVEQPFVPPVLDDEVLIMPKLFDNPSDMIIQATTDRSPLTATYAQYRYAATNGLIPIFDNGIIGTMAIECYLWVLNQDNAQSRMLRYYNWFDYALRFNSDVTLSETRKYPNFPSITEVTLANLYLYCVGLRRSGPSSVSSTLLESVKRQSGISITIAADIRYVDGPINQHDL